MFRVNVWSSSAAEPYEDGPFMIGYTKTDGSWHWLLNAAMWKQGKQHHTGAVHGTVGCQEPDHAAQHSGRDRGQSELELSPA